MALIAYLSGNMIVAAIISSLLFLASLSPNLYPRGALFFAINAANVTKVSGKSMGGTAGKFSYAYLEDIASWPVALTPAATAAAAFADLVTVPLADPFVMLTGKYFQQVDCILEEGEVKHTQIGPRDCAAFENSYDNVYPGNDAAYLGFNALMANKDVVVIAEELNGTFRVIGFPNFPARLEKSDGTGGKKVADGRKNNLSFVSRGPIPPPIYQAPIPLAP